MFTGRKGESTLMTQQLDPQVLLDAIRAQAETLKRMQAEMEALRRERATEGLPDEPLRVIWRLWEEQVLSRPDGQEGARSDSVQAMAHKRLILDLEFKHKGEALKLGDVPVSKLTVPMVNDWRATLQLQIVSKGKHKGEPISPSYRNRILASLRSLLSWRYPGQNPLTRVKCESTAGRGREGWFKDEDHLEQWLAHANPQYQRIARVACSAGAMRVTEARLLMEHEVNWDPNVRSITLPGGKQGRVKNGEGRTFALSVKNFEILQAAREEATVCRYRHCEVLLNRKLAPYNWDNHRHLFQHQAYSDGRAPSRRTMVNWGTDAGKRYIAAGGEPLGPKKERPSSHHLRHTGATWNTFKSKGNMHKVMKDAGWKDTKIAMKYAKRTSEMMEEAAAAEEQSMKEAVAQRLAELREGDRQDPQPAKKTPFVPGTRSQDRDAALARKRSGTEP